MKLVSVWMITYNHEKFIKEAIESILSQKTSFGFEVVIGDDCSTDATPSIILDYQQKYPEIIRPFLYKKNIGIAPNLLKTMSECKSKYIALLEGDDYWTDDTKLQQQVDFLEKNPDFSVCFHDISVKYQETGEIKKPKSARKKQISTTKDILRYNYIPTCTVLFRNVTEGIFPEWISTLSMADWPVHILNALNGKLYFLPRTMAVYRIHGSSGWSVNLSSIEGKEKTTKSKLRLFLQLADNMPSRWHGLIEKQITLQQRLLGFYAGLVKNEKPGLPDWLWLIGKSLAGHYDCTVCLKVLIKYEFKRTR
jgi:glycosyltransferase involved in cell wall biosynthesis